MSKKQYKTLKSKEEKSTPDWRDIRGLPFDQAFFPRIVREFDDGADEKPMFYRDD